MTASTNHRDRSAPPPRWLYVVTAAVASVHAGAAAMQPVWAGRYFSADYGMLAVHYLGANVVYCAACAQLLLSLALWWRSRRHAWFALASVALVAAETMQFVAGSAGDLAVHLPLGVAVVTGAVVTSWTFCVGGRTARDSHRTHAEVTR